MMKMFKKKERKSDDAIKMPLDSSAYIDVASLGLVEGVGPDLLPDYRSSGISITEFITKWAKLYPLEEEVDVVVKKIDELRKLLWDMPMYKPENHKSSQGRKWYKLWNVDPVEDIMLNELYWCNDLVLFRYLRSYKYKVQQSFLMIKKTLAWRRYKKVETADPDLIGRSNTNGMVYRKGYDKVGRPFVYFRPKDESDHNRDNQVMLIFLGLELSTQTALWSQGNDKVIIIIDLNDWSLSYMPTIELIIDTVRALSEHYTDVMHEIIIIDAPLLMDPLMQMIKAVLDTSTAKKINMKHRGSQFEAMMKERMDPSQLEVSMGGENNTLYDHKLYWKHESEQARIYRERIEEWVKLNEPEWIKKHESQTKTGENE